MKTLDLFCASPASTAICSSMDHRSMVRQGGIKPIDPHHHHHETKTPIVPCSSTEFPISPKPHFDKYRKSTSSSPRLSLEFLRRKSSADVTDLSSPPPTGSSRYLLSDTPLLLDFLSEEDDDSEDSSSTSVPARQPPCNKSSSSKQHRISSEYPVFRSSLSANSYESNPVFESYSSSSLSSNLDALHSQKSSPSRLNHALKSAYSRAHDNYFHAQKSSPSRFINNHGMVQKSPLSRVHDDFHSEKSSPSRLNHEVQKSPLSRVRDDFHSEKSSPSLLNHEVQKSPLSRVDDDFHTHKASLPRSSTTQASSKSSLTSTNESHAFKSSRTHDYQVVELRVSIHCKGCEGKIRKHISRMEGVTSFSIDLATKKVRVIGNVTPLGVLTSISKVKNAEFWPSPTSTLLEP